MPWLPWDTRPHTAKSGRGGLRLVHKAHPMKVTKALLGDLEEGAGGRRARSRQPRGYRQMRPSPRRQGDPGLDGPMAGCDRCIGQGQVERNGVWRSVRRGTSRGVAIGGHQSAHRRADREVARWPNGSQVRCGRPERFRSNGPRKGPDAPSVRPRTGSGHADEHAKFRARWCAEPDICHLDVRQGCVVLA